MPDNQSNSNVFSKDELASLFSSDMGRLGTVTNQRNNKQTKGSSQKSKTFATASADTDISNLGSSETAFLLRQQQQQQRNQKSNITKMQNTRYRAENHKHPSMMHQKQVDILAGITAAVVQSTTSDDSNLHLNFDQKDSQINHLDVKNDDDDEDDEDDNFIQRRQQKIKNKKMIQSNKQSRNESDVESDNEYNNRHETNRRTRRRQDSESSDDSSSSSESSSDNDSESEDEDAVDERRNRLRARVLVKKRDNLPSPPEQNEDVPKKEIIKDTTTELPKSKPLMDDNSSKDEDSSSSDDSSSDDSSSEDSSSEEEDIHVVAKPLFIPKSKRGNLREASQRAAEEEEIQKNKEYQKQSQTLQSRALVAQLLEKEKSNKSSQFSYNDEDDNPKSDDECGGTLEPPPDDNDDTTNDPMEASKQRDSWQVRELVRILQIYDILEEEKRAAEELEFRRGLTDAEIMALEGDNKKRKDDHARNNKDKSHPKYMQRFYHRGAFYLDEDSMKNDPNDVRNKAKEYALAPTGEDKIDKRNLPKIMQVKKFGYAGYSTKYKGLKEEDTTDRRSTYIPLKRKRR